MNNCVLVLLGISGDLAKKKLIPAIYMLMKKGVLSTFALIGAAYDATTAREVINQARPYIHHIDEAIFEQLIQATYYQQLNFLNKQDFISLAKLVEKVEKQHNLSGNRVFYCATAADFFGPITQALAESGLAAKLQAAAPWHRIVYEKPFGRDLASAEAINQCIARYFNEQQIYRIDHYLTKDIVSNIALLRFTNCIFEPLWNNRYIDHVQIVLNESIGTEHRTAYYNSYGAIKDVMQNHILEMLALVGMEAPERLTGEAIQLQRAKVLQEVLVVDGLVGQYEGYQQENPVNAHSTTETFAAAVLMINNQRWQGIPFYIKTGKCLSHKETAIHIKFKPVECLLTQNCPSDSNYLTIQIAPDSSFFLTINAKKPGQANDVMPIKMNFCHNCLFAGQEPEAYEILLQEIMHGDNAVSVRFDEIEAAWKIVEALKALPLPLYIYQKGSAGPSEMEYFCKKHGFRWRS